MNEKVETSPSVEKFEVDWMEAFYILALLVAGDRWAEAEKYIDTIIKRPFYIQK